MIERNHFLDQANFIAKSAIFGPLFIADKAVQRPRPPFRTDRFAIKAKCPVILNMRGRRRTVPLSRAVGQVRIRFYHSNTTKMRQSDHAEDEAVLILHDEKTPSKKVVGRKTGSGIFKIRSPSVGRKLSSKASQECMTFSVYCLCDRL